MKKLKAVNSSSIPINQTIIELYKHLNISIDEEVDTFHINTHEEIRDELPAKVAPFRNNFYEISLVSQGSSLEYRINKEKFITPKSYLVFNAPGQVHHWKGIAGDLSGFVMFFQPEYVGQTFHETVLSEFPFFNISETNLIEVENDQLDKLKFYFSEIYENYKSTDNFQQEMVKANLQTILWLSNKIYNYNRNEEQRGNDSITARYRHLVNENFKTISTVTEYANLLHITPNYLSQTIQSTLGINAKSLIDERLLLEADYLLSYTKLSIKEIGYKLNFDEPTHFNRFYKKNRGKTPGSVRT